MMRILSISYDAALLRPEDPTNENQFRQKCYCEQLDQQKQFIVMARDQVEEPSVIWAAGRATAFNACSRSPWRALVRALRLGWSEGRAFHPTLVEYQDPLWSGWVAWLLSVVLKVPLVGGVFSDLFNKSAWYKKSFWHRMAYRGTRFLFNRTAMIRCDSAEMTQSLVSQGWRAQHIPFFIPWIEKFQATPADIEARLQRWEREPLILCVARLVPEKNIEMLLDSFASLQHPRARLRIVGRGPLLNSLQTKAQALGIDSRLEWIPQVDFETLVSFYREANLFALPSHFESAARVLIQAQAARLPTVTTATAGSADIVLEGLSGFVTPIGATNAFASAMKQLLTDFSVYERMLHSTWPNSWKQHQEAAIIPQLKDFYSQASRSAN
jgi:glycosyltransferase involved in cell wall biosynthesis